MTASSFETYPHKPSTPKHQTPIYYAHSTSARTHLLRVLYRGSDALGAEKSPSSKLLGRHLGPVEVTVGVLAGDPGGRLQGTPMKTPLSGRTRRRRFRRL